MRVPDRADVPPLRAVETRDENFASWEKFWRAYYQPIRVALGLMPFIGEAGADDAAQGFFMKLHRLDLLANRPAIRQRFRDWLYVTLRRFAVDEWRRQSRSPERPSPFDTDEPADPRPAADDEPFGADELYALSVLHLTVRRVREHCLREGMSEHWMIFEELVLAPMIPGREAKTRDEVLAMFPNERPNFLNNRLTTVYRAFCRMLPALIPADPTEGRTPDERFDELLEILRGSARSRLWLAFLQVPAGDEGDPAGSSLDLAVRSIGGVPALAVPSPETFHDELRILLGFWLEMPLEEYIDDARAAGPAVAEALRRLRPRPPGSYEGRGDLDRDRPGGGPGPFLSLRTLVEAKGPGPGAAVDGVAIPARELADLLGRIKDFAKRIHRPRRRRSDRAEAAPVAGWLEDAMPFEIAQVIYNLAGALALTRSEARIVRLDDDQFRKNITWALNQTWLDPTLRPTFSAALAHLGPPSPPAGPGESPARR